MDSPVFCAYALGALVLSASARVALAADGAEDVLTEIVVTAEKQDQFLQKVPAAITAITANTLVSAGVTDLRAAEMLVPGARFQAEGNNNQVFIRGVGAGLDLVNVEPSVGYIFNGSYVPREETSAALFDIAQIEVLPGPQGTLYGRSAIGGTVNVEPVRPSHDESGSALIEVGNFAAMHASYAQNVRVTNDLTLRPAVDYSEHLGYETSGADSKNDLGVRLSALYEPLANASMLVWAQYSGKAGHPANLVNKGLDPADGRYAESAFLTPNPWNDTRDGALTKYAAFGRPLAERQVYDSAMIGARLDFRLGPMTLTDIPSYLYLDSNPDYWLGTIRARLYAHYNQVANELRLTAVQGPINWLLGLYLYRVEDASKLTLFTNGVLPSLPDGLVQSNIPYSRLRNVAVFGQARWEVTDAVRLLAGGRWSVDARDAHGVSPDETGDLPWTYQATFRHFDYRIGVEVDTSGHSMAYASVQTGYKPGSYNEVPSTAAFSNSVRPSNLRAFTLGHKSMLFSRTLEFNAEAFWYDYRDLAIQAYDINAPFNPVFNAQKITIRGGQVDLAWKAAAQTQLTLSATYMHARNDEFITPGGEDYSGLQPPYAPDRSAVASLLQGFPAWNGTLQLRVDGRYESDWYADYVHNRGTRQGAWTKGDASLTFQSGGQWSLGAWVKNFTDTAVIAATAAAGVPGPATAYLEPPRTYGLRATLRF